IDAYYIHNPESQLGFVSEDEFYARLRKAFEFLESARANNKIRMYGVATWNGFRVPRESRQYHSLPRMEEIAREVAGQSHGFKIVQLPFNLGMPEALTIQSQTIDGQDVSAIEAASALDITLISSASILQGRVAQDLPETIREPLGSLATDAQTAIQFVRSTPGVTTALVGMSRKKHVEENLQLVSVEPSSTEDFLRLFSDA
ncbi:MAG TPA: aldo/keto reductase, partial [Pyrinomonadaceae bacterium]